MSKKKNNNSLINDGYKKPITTATELLSPEEIKTRLKNFYRLLPDNIIDLPINTRIQYFQVLPENKFKYRSGGTLIINKAPLYLILSNGRKNWSVQLDSHIIFAGEDIDKIKEEYEKKLLEKDKKIKHLTLYIKNLKNTINQ